MIKNKNEETNEEKDDLFQKWTKDKVKKKFANIKNNWKNEMVIKKNINNKKLFQNENLQRLTNYSKYSTKSKTNSTKTNNFKENNKKGYYYIHQNKLRKSNNLNDYYNKNNKFSKSTKKKNIKDINNFNNEVDSIKLSFNKNNFSNNTNYINRGVAKSNKLFYNSIDLLNKKLIWKKENLKNKQKKEMKECTFKPKINKFFNKTNKINSLLATHKLNVSYNLNIQNITNSNKNKPKIVIENVIKNEFPNRFIPKPVEKPNLLLELKNNQININNLFKNQNKIIYKEKDKKISKKKKLKTLDFL